MQVYVVCGHSIYRDSQVSGANAFDWSDGRTREAIKYNLLLPVGQAQIVTSRTPKPFEALWTPMEWGGGGRNNTILFIIGTEMCSRGFHRSIWERPACYHLSTFSESSAWKLFYELILCPFRHTTLIIRRINRAWTVSIFALGVFPFPPLQEYKPSKFL